MEIWRLSTNLSTIILLTVGAQICTLHACTMYHNNYACVYILEEAFLIVRAVCYSINIPKYLFQGGETKIIIVAGRPIIYRSPQKLAASYNCSRSACSL